MGSIRWGEQKPAQQYSVPVSKDPAVRNPAITPQIPAGVTDGEGANALIPRFLIGKPNDVPHSAIHEHTATAIALLMQSRNSYDANILSARIRESWRNPSELPLLRLPWSDSPMIEIVGRCHGR
jgi:hypothetical protein